MKRWIDLVEENMREENCLTGCRGWGWLEEESSERNGQPPLARKIHQDNKWMIMQFQTYKNYENTTDKADPLH